MEKSYRLICISSSSRHNKFWFCDIYPDGREHRRWGRVGAKGQQKTFERGSLQVALRKAASTANSKLYPRGSREPYTELDLVESQVNAIMTGASLEDITVSQINTNSTQLKSLIKFLVRQNIHNITARTQITYTNGQLKTPLGVVSRQAISKARGYLARISGYVQKQRQNSPRFVSLVEDYMRVIPLAIGSSGFDAVAIFPGIKAVQEQIDILDAMDVVLSNGGAQVATADQTTEKVFDVSLEILTDRDEIVRIKKLYESTARRGHRSYNLKVKAVYTLSVGPADTAFESDGRKVGNIHETWHGTKDAHLLSILKGGLVIVPSSAGHTTGRMYGDGLYSSHVSTKALNYATDYWGGRSSKRAFMLLCETALGRHYEPRSSSEVCNVRQAPRGYNSVWAKPGRELINDEVIVYRASQMRIKYLVEFE